MRLIHKKSRFNIITLEENTILINDPFLKKELLYKGISIPLYKRSEYGMKSSIKMEDPLFLKAFKEIFVKTRFSDSSYIWLA